MENGESANFRMDFDGGNPCAATAVLCGDWLKSTCVGDCRDAFCESLAKLPENVGAMAVEASGLGKWDGYFVLMMSRLAAVCRERGIAFDDSGLPAGVRHLMKMAKGNRKAAPAEEKDETFFHSIGSGVLDYWNRFMDVMLFVGELVQASGRLFTGGLRMRGGDFVEQLFLVGPKATALVSLIGFLMGVILAFIGAIPLKWFNAEPYVASLVGIGMLRLMAPVMVGVVMAGRTAAAYAAELGTMRVNQEMDSLSVLGISPMDFLIMPRYLAMTLMFPFLCIFADVLSVLGGGLVGMAYLGLGWLEYYTTLVGTVRQSDFYVGLVSCFIFGVLVAACGCYQGLRCGRNAAAVGRAATRAVVCSIISIVIATAVITILSVILGF